MTKTMMISPIQTEVFHPGQDLVEFILAHVEKNRWQEGSILAITSKILSLAEKALVPTSEINKKDLIRKEADHYLGEIGFGVSLTIKGSLLLPAAGIDESNSENGDYILYPKDPWGTADSLRKALCLHTGLKDFGVLITDSRSGPLRHGTVGVAVSVAGFSPLRNMIGEKDIFGRELKITKINIADSLAAAAVLLMGEADERCPLAMITGASVHFTPTVDRASWEIPPEDDMYQPLYKHLMK